jgi:hypothetical protein
LKYKNSLLRGDLTYKVTAGPNGTHILHLLSTPGSPNMVGGVAADDTWGWNNYANCYVWYTYYDTNGLDAEECRRANNNVMLTPDQVPLDKIDFTLLNEPTKVIVRKIFIAKAKQTLAMVRGKFSGKLSIHDAEANMDYAMLNSQAEKEYDAAIDSLDKRLERMSPSNILQKQAEMVENMEKILKSKPLKMIIV